ncbi:MAG: cbb3-type cytochrome oxidase assembly protein CcoS [Arenicella sp.]|nr:cbb3-type cytochrome oxidase assembly protein CcoS [Arenicella sp.]
MEIIYLLIPLSLILVAAALWAFFWAVKSGQFDDLDSPALDILDDDSPASENDDAHTGKGSSKKLPSN